MPPTSSVPFLQLCPSQSLPHVPLTFPPDIVTVFLSLVVTILPEHSCREESECYGLLSSVQL